MSSRPIGFTGLLLDRADNIRELSERISELAAAEEALLMQLAGIEPTLTSEGRLSWSKVEGDAAVEGLLFLGLQENRPLFAPLERPEPGQALASVFAVVESLAPDEAALWGIVHSVTGWHQRSRFCGSCGGATEPIRAGWARRCRDCNTEHFPRVDPVVIMLAEHDEQILIGRQPFFPPGRYSALAGFVEPGESIEEAVARELMEEAGIAVTGVRYVSSQPWPFPGQLMIGCIASSSSSDLRLDPKELEDAIWVDRKQVAAALAGTEGAAFVPPPPFAIAHSLLEHWLESR